MIEAKKWEDVLQYLYQRYRIEDCAEAFEIILRLTEGNDFSRAKSLYFLRRVLTNLHDTQTTLRLQSALEDIPSMDIVVRGWIELSNTVHGDDWANNTTMLFERYLPTKGHDPDLDFWVYDMTAWAHNCLGNYERMLILAKELTPTMPLLKIERFNVLGSAYRELGLLKKAVDHYIAGIEIATANQYVRYLAGLNSNIAVCLWREGKVEMAMKQAEFALSYIESTSESDYQATILSNLELYTRKWGDLGKAEAYIDRALSLSKAATTPGYAGSLMEHGSLLLVKGRYAEAIAPLEEALSHSSLEYYHRCSILENLLAAYAKSGQLENIDRALEMLEIERKSFTRRRSEALIFENTQINAQLHAEERKNLELRLQEEASRLKLQQEHFERELANSTLQLVAQTELLSGLRDDLLNVVRRFPMSDGATKALREKLNELPCKAIDWPKFEEQFRAAHPEFVKSLIERYPNLSPSEVRICSLIRMNMKSEEIARLLCLSARSIESHRYSIRKKMQLTRSEDLLIHMQKL